MNLINLLPFYHQRVSVLRFCHLGALSHEQNFLCLLDIVLNVSNIRIKINEIETSYKTIKCIITNLHKETLSRVETSTLSAETFENTQNSFFFFTFLINLVLNPNRLHWCHRVDSSSQPFEREFASLTHRSRLHKFNFILADIKYCKISKR